MFGELWLYITFFLILVGSLAGQQALVILGTFFFLTGGVARLWSRWALWRVEYERVLSENRAFIGEDVEVTLRVANRKPMPLLWIEIQEEFPDTIPLEGGTLSPSSSPNRAYLSNLTSLSWYERVSWSYRLECTARGYYRIGPTRLRTGDIFGFFPAERREEKVDYLLVYPRTVPLGQLGLPQHRPFGDVRSEERIFEDPSRIMGLREYHPHDPFKRIDWKATARRQELQVKVFEPTITLHLIVVLNVNTYPHSWLGYDPILLEEAVTVAASVARHGGEERWAVGLLANGSFPQSDLPLRIPPGRAPDQLTHILEALAVVIPMATLPIEDVLKEESHRLPWGATLAVVTAVMTPSLADALISLREAGHRVVLLWVGEGRPLSPSGEGLEGIPAYPVSQFLRAHKGGPP